MSQILIVISAIVALAVLYVLLPVVVHTFQHYRQKKVLRCPETEGLAEVDVDASHAAISSAFGRALLKVKNCTLWPKRKGCAENCLKE